MAPSRGGKRGKMNEDHSTEGKPANKLWTRDFTIITLGSVVSMVGGTMTGFAISSMVLDYTGSTFLYALFNICFQIPMLVCPLLAGPVLDRMSRKKVIYSLDFLSSFVFLVFYLVMRSGWFSYPFLLAGTLLIGAIDGVYVVAYDSFYPNLISEGNYSKAYSVSSMLWPIAAMSTPIAAMVYDRLGTVTPLFLFNALCFFTAAAFERTIKYQETHMDKAPPADGMGPLKRFRRDFREGVTYIAGEKGLLVITAYFVVSNFSGSGAGNLYLPFFRNHPQLFAMWPIAVVTLYSIVSNFSVAGRFVGGLIHYKVKFPTEKKFAIAMTVYVTICFLEMGELFMPIPIMAAMFFLEGLLSVTSYNIRISATQSYLPDTKRARFNGTFTMLCSMGSIAGTLLSGALAEALPERGIIIAFNVLSLIAAYFLMYRGRDHVKKIYNQAL